MKVHYDKDEDILMIELTKDKNKKIDDTFETDDALISVTETGEPILLEIFHAKQFFSEAQKVLPKEIKQQFFSNRVL